MTRVETIPFNAGVRITLDQNRCIAEAIQSRESARLRASQSKRLPPLPRMVSL